MLLTLKERQVLILIVKGGRNPEIAKELGIKINTVKAYKTRILDKYRKFGVPSFKELKDAIDEATGNSESIFSDQMQIL